jgi:hypothetical protein
LTNLPKHCHDQNVVLEDFRKRMIDQQRISAEWASRGFSCEVWTDPPGQGWEDFTHETVDARFELCGGNTPDREFEGTMKCSTRT